MRQSPRTSRRTRRGKASGVADALRLAIARAEWLGASPGRKRLAAYRSFVLSALVLGEGLPREFRAVLARDVADEALEIAARRRRPLAVSVEADKVGAEVAG